MKNAALGTSGPERERTSSHVGPIARDVKLVVNAAFCFLVSRHCISSAALAIEIRYPRVIPWAVQDSKIRDQHAKPGLGGEIAISGLEFGFQSQSDSAS